MSSGSPSASSRPAARTRIRVGEIEYEIHVVLDQQDRDIRRQSGEGGENVPALLLWNPRGGLVEKEHARTRRERQRDLQQPLLAVGQFARRPVHLGLEAEAREQLLDFGDDPRPCSRHAPEISARAVAFRDREPKRTRRASDEEKAG